MNSGNAAIQLEPATDSGGPSRRSRRWWSTATTGLVAALFLQAVFAGAMLSGVEWARPAHRMTAAVIIAWTLLAAVVSTIMLGRIAGGPKLSLALFGLAAAEFLQMAAGSAVAKGANLMWLHIPLGVALVAFAGAAAAMARRLGGER